MSTEKSLIYIEWCDSISDTPHWVTMDTAIEWANNEDWIIKQAAFLLQETDEFILIASQYNEQQETESRFSNLHKIPKTWIKKRVDLSSIVGIQ